MFTGSEGEEQILILLGLTSLQAKVYIALAKMDQATLTSLSSSSKIDRANVYRVITQLQELGFVEKMMMNPTHFKALPIDEGMSMLLESKETEYLEVKTKTKDILERYKQHTKVDFDDRSCQFALIPDGKLTQRKFDQMFDSNQETHDIMFYWRDYASDYYCVVELWTNLLDKGVKIRALVFLEKGEKLPKEIHNLTKYGKIFEIRRTLTPPKATITIIDGKESMVSVSPHLCPCGKPSFWVHNQSIIGVIQEYFDMLWRRSKKNALATA